MQQNPASKTVKGLNIATLILSILGALVFILCMACTGLIQGYVNDHSDTLATEFSEAIQNGSVNMNVTVDATDAAQLQQLAAALDSTGNKELSTIASMLSDLSKGNVVSTYNFVMNSDADSIIAAKNAVADMTDAELQAIADATSGATLDDLKELRSEAASVSDSQITAAFQALDATTGGDIVLQVNNLIGGSFQVLFAIGLILNIICIVASILALRNANNPEKLGGAFVMAIIAAIASFFGAALVSLILYIISAVYISKVRKGMPAQPQQPVIEANVQ